MTEQPDTQQARERLSALEQRDAIVKKIAALEQQLESERASLKAIQDDISASE